MKKFNIILPNDFIASNLFQIRKDYPFYFRDEIMQIMVMHTFSYSIWSNRKQNLKIDTYEYIEAFLNKLKDNNSNIVFSFENTKIENKHLGDRYSNMLLEIAEPYGAYAIIYSEKLADYIKTKYPNIKLICSAARKQYINKYPFDLNALNYDIYKDFINQINEKSQTVLYTNSYCKNSYKCNDKNSKHILNYEVMSDNICPNILKTFDDVMKEKTFINENEMKKLSEIGIEFFIIKVPEESNVLEILNPYVYYLIKPQYRDNIRLELLKNMIKLEKKFRLDNISQ